jgi:hypothetical protein
VVDEGGAVLEEWEVQLVAGPVALKMVAEGVEVLDEAQLLEEEEVDVDEVDVVEDHMVTKVFLCMSSTNNSKSNCQANV